MSPSLSYITWQRHAGRAQEIADALGGEAVPIHYPQLTSGVPRNLLRYAISAVTTAGHLARHRPRAVIVTNPPAVPGLIVTAYAALSGRRFVLDSHPTAFGAKDHAVARRLLPLHRAMARRASAVMVTTSTWVDEVQRWGGRGLVVHEAPPRWRVAPWRSSGGRPRVLFVGVFGSDEPVDVVLDAARLVPEVDLHITGDPRRCPADLRASLPANVRLVGFLGPPEYRQAVEEADVVLVLTTEATSVVRAGYEAVYAQRSLVVTGTPVLREVFPLAVHTDNTAEGVSAAVREALSLAGQGQRLVRALELQQSRWDGQLAALRAVLGTGSVQVPVDAPPGQ